MKAMYGTPALITAIGFAGALPAAFAQPVLAVQATAQDTASVPTLEEVVVTAQKREENLQKVPVSVQVFTSRDLQSNNVTDLTKLAETAPSVHIVNTGDFFSNSLFIRGIGSGPNPGFDQSVGTFVDGVYIGRSRMISNAFLDLDRIEVLKGPQSTFFGNSAIAGALNMTTAKPAERSGGWARMLYGTHGRYAAEGAVSQALLPTLAVRVAATVNGQDGWITNVVTGERAPHDDNKGIRGTVRFEPMDSLAVLYKIEANRSERSGTFAGLPLQWGTCPAPEPFFISAVRNCSLIIGQDLPRDIDTNENVGLAGQGYTLSNFGNVLTINHDISDYTLTSITSFYKFDFEGYSDPAQVPMFQITTYVPEKYRQFSQEARISSAQGRRLEWLAGFYYQNGHLDTKFITDTTRFNNLASRPGNEALLNYLPLSYISGFVQDETVASLFASGKFHITDELSLTAGIRSTWVEKNSVGAVSYGTTNDIYAGFIPIPANLELLWSSLSGPPGSLALARSDHAWTPSFGVNYEISPAVLAYATYSKGFKAGGMNAAVPVGEPEDLMFGPEHVDAFELGVKSKWLDNRLLANVTAFRSNYQDLQASILVEQPATGSFLSRIRNAPRSITQGVEFEMQWLVTENFRLAVNGSYLDTYYARYPNAAQTKLQQFCASSAANYAQPACAAFPNPVPRFADLVGKATPYSPKWSGSLSASYASEIAGFESMIQLSPYLTTDYYTVSGDPVYRVPGYVRWDARWVLSKPGRGWHLELIGKNLTDKTIVSVPATNTGYGLQAKEEPINVALQLRYEW